MNSKEFVDSLFASISDEQLLTYKKYQKSHNVYQDLLELDFEFTTVGNIIYWHIVVGESIEFIIEGRAQTFTIYFAQDFADDVEDKVMFDVDHPLYALYSEITF